MTVSPIQSGVPIPPRNGNGSQASISVAVWELAVGQYRAFICGANDDPSEVQHDVLGAGRRFKYKLITRKLNGCGIGVWRVG